MNFTVSRIHLGGLICTPLRISPADGFDYLSFEMVDVQGIVETSSLSSSSWLFYCSG